MAMDRFTRAPDPRDIRVTCNGVTAERGDGLILRLAVEDGTDAEGCEVSCFVSGSTASSYPLDAKSIEVALARYLDLSWPPEFRLTAVRACAELGGEYQLNGDADLGLYVAELPIRVPG